MTRIETGIAKSYAKNWTVEQALRELVQNILDLRAEGIETRISWADGEASFKDYGAGLELRHLAVGISEKGSVDAIGQFGEGLKLALLVLAREGRAVQIRSRGRIIRPVLAVGQFETETLSFEIEPMAPRHAATHMGTTIRVECSEDELQAGKAYFLAYESVDWLERGRISRPEAGESGWIYINGSRIAQLDGMRFNYHMSGEEARNLMNRDRQTVDAGEANGLVAKIIARTSSTEVIGTILRDAVGNDRSWEIQNVSIASFDMRGRESVWMRVWNANFPANAVLPGDGTDNRRAEYRGYQVLTGVSIWWTHLLSKIGVASAREVSHEQVAHIEIPELTADEQSRLDWALATIKENYADAGTVKVAVDLDGLVGAAAGTKVLGCYDRATDTIYLRQSQLESAKATLSTLLHETVHKVSGAEDLTAEFENALLQVAVGILVR
jgi:hypothetical protein